MKLKKKILLALFLTFLLSAIVISSAPAQTRTADVHAGEWFEYSSAFQWSSTDPNATIAPELQALNDTERLLISILNVSGTNVTFQATAYFRNGTEQPQVGTVDVDTGEGNLTMLVVSANLSVGDSVYSLGGYSALKINETTVRTYPDTTRETNHLGRTIESNISGVYSFLSIDYYWDRPSGIIVEYSQTLLEINVSQTTWSFSYTITDSNVWVIPEFSTWTLTLLIPIILTISLAFYKRRLFKIPNH